MSEVRKSIVINREYLNPNAQRKNKNSLNGSSSTSTSGSR